MDLCIPKGFRRRIKRFEGDTGICRPWEAIQAATASAKQERRKRFVTGAVTADKDLALVMAYKARKKRSLEESVGNAWPEPTPP